jgi:hypothetical protein
MPAGIGYGGVPQGLAGRMQPFALGQQTPVGASRSYDDVQMESLLRTPNPWEEMERRGRGELPQNLNEVYDAQLLKKLIQMPDHELMNMMSVATGRGDPREFKNMGREGMIGMLFKNLVFTAPQRGI